MSGQTVITPGSLDPNAGGGGGGFSLTPWAVEALFANIDSDPNDAPGGPGVAITAPGTYDPKKEYIMTTVFTFPAAPANAGAAGPTTVNAYLPWTDRDGDVSHTSGFLADFTTTAWGSLVFDRSTGATDWGQIGYIPTGIIGTPPGKEFHIADLFTGFGYVGLDLGTGAFIKNFQLSGGGLAATYFLVMGRQVDP